MNINVTAKFELSQHEIRCLRVALSQLEMEMYNDRYGRSEYSDGIVSVKREEMKQFLADMKELLK